MQHLFENTKDGRTVKMLQRKGKTLLQLGKDWIDRGPCGTPTTIEEERIKEKKLNAKEDEKITREVKSDLDKEENTNEAQDDTGAEEEDVKALADMTVRELNEYAALNEIEVPGGLKKAELVEFIQKATQVMP